MGKIYSDAKMKRLHNWVSQIWPFAHEMQKGDLVVVPLKSQPAVQIDEITGEYTFEPKGPNPYYDWRPVKWVGEAIPRVHFSQDLLYTFGAFLTICRIKRNNAEARIEAMRKNGWKPETLGSLTAGGDGNGEDVDLEELGQDQIIKVIGAKFKGHALTGLVDAILKARVRHLSKPRRGGWRS